MSLFFLFAGAGLVCLALLYGAGAWAAIKVWLGR